LVRGPSVFPGYFRNEEATARALRDGWLHTGDLVRRDAEGYYQVIDRISDIYISGGESISPSEVEGVLVAHPAVADVAVVGVPDDRWGEVGVAFVVTRPGIATDETELTQFCQKNLASYKVPKRIILTASIPRSGANKVRRRELVAQFEALRESESGASVNRLGTS